MSGELAAAGGAERITAGRSVTMVARLRRGAFSLLTTTAIGTRPPRPRQARKRRTMSSVRSLAWVTASVRTENQITVPSIIGRRPIRSVSGPVTSAPSATPMIPAVNTGPRSPRPRFHALVSAGAT
jgi:hypothetical protein